MSAEERSATGQPDVYKQGSPRVADQIIPSPLGIARAFANGMAGLTKAMTSGLEAFNQKLTDENMTAVGLDNGFIQGSVAANTRFLEEAAKISQQMYDELRSSVGQGKQAYRQDIDYDRLASLIAEKLRGQSAPSSEPQVPAPSSSK